MGGGLNIAALARRTGVSADTLRKWEQRYGVLRPARTPGGQRRYSELDLARVEWLRDRLAEGFRIGEAARLLERTDGEARRTPADLREALVEAAAAADVGELERLLDQSFSLHRLELTLVRIVRPVLERIGEGWAAGELSIAQEHLVTSAIRARLERLLSDLRGGVRGVAVLGCSPGERHELGLMMLATLLRADGWQVAYLGADTPLGDSYGLAVRLNASFVGLSVAMAERVERLQAAVAGCPRPAGVEVVLGGAAARQKLARSLGARYVDGDLRRCVRELRRLAQ